MTTSAKIGLQYDKIAQWWNARQRDSDYGVAQVERALAMGAQGGRALDVGCGSGGRLIRRLTERKLDVTGLDISAEMIKLAKQNHPDCQFIHGDIRSWETDIKFDFILAWDSLFHLPLDEHKPVLSKLCQWLSPDGIMIHTFGNAKGAHSDTWRDQVFHYSSIGIAKNIEVLHENNMALMHLELDQFPEKHVYIISKKL